MFKAVMIIIVMYNGSVSTTSTNFRTLDNCNTAKKAVEASIPEFYIKPSITCHLK